jgi:peptidoglycan/LPS O-acetylase OafA/YrhL
MDIVGNIGIFLGGMLASLIFSKVITRKKTPLSFRLMRFSSVCSLALLLFFSLLAIGVFGTRVYALSYPYYYDIFAAGLILSVALSSGTFFNHLLTNTWLRAIGLVSYSFYIIHYLVIKLIEAFFKFYLGTTLNEITLLLLAGIISYCAACFSYSYIERPFMRSPTVKEKQ